MSRRAKTGRANIKDYETEYAMAKFTPVRDKLLEDTANLNDSTITNKELAILSCQIQNFMEEHLGRYSKPPWSMTRIPSKMFRDYSPDGSLYIVLSECYRYKREMYWRGFSFSSKTKKEENMELLGKIEEALINARKWRQPCIYFHSNVPASMCEDLTRIVTRHSGSVVSSPKKATHIVKFDPKVDSNENEDVDYLRTLEIHNDANLAFVHWWYFPDSYDQWLPLADVEGQMPEDDPPLTKTVVVCCRFIKDVGIFNEWMNEGDYEIEAGGEDLELSLVKSEKDKKKKRKKDKEDGGKRKRKRESKGGEGSGAATKQPGVVQASTGEFRAGENGVVVKGASGIRVARPSDHRLHLTYSGIGPAEERPRGGRGKDIQDHRKTTSGELGLPRPRCARWFDMNDLEPHPIEKRMLPEFFESPSRCLAKTAQVYIYYRNFMVTCYRQRPHEYLTATACRRNLAGDACAVLRVHEFLEHWGLINNDVAPAARPAGVRVPSASAIDLIAGRAEWADPDLAGDATTRNPNVMIEALNQPRQGVIGGGTDEAAAEERSSSGEGLSESTSAGLDVGSARAAGSFAAAMTHMPGWTQAQTKALLEAVNLQMQRARDGPDKAGSADMDWQKVSAAVGGDPVKKPDECMKYFVLMPIQEQFLADEDHLAPPRPACKTASSSGGDGYGRSSSGGSVKACFSKFGKEALVQMAQLLHGMAPNVAAAAVKAALEEVQSSAGSKMVESSSNNSSSSGDAGDGDPMDTSGSDSSSEEEQVSAAVVVAAVAVKAKSLADAAELETQQHLSAMLQRQLLQTQLKLREFNELAETLRVEKEQLEKDKHELYTEKMRFMSEKTAMEATRATDYGR